MSGQVGLQRLAGLVLALVAAVGAVLSYASLYAAAVPTFGPVLAAGFPLLVDALVLGASLRYVAGARVGRPRAGWRLTAHVGVAATIALNALAAPDVVHVPWHVTAPAVWSLLVELTARDVLGEWRASHVPGERIPFRLWVTAPIESAATWLRVARQHAHARHRLDVGKHAAAVEAVRVATGGRASARRVRRILRRQLRAGSLPPGDVLGALGGLDETSAERDAALVLRTALRAVLTAPHTQPENGEPVPGPAAASGATQRAGGPLVPGRAAPTPNSAPPASSSAAPIEPVEPPPRPHVVPPPLEQSDGSSGESSAGLSGEARDLEALRGELAEAIRTQALPADASAEAIRTHLRIGAARARTLRAELRARSA